MEHGVLTPSLQNVPASQGMQTGGDVGVEGSGHLGSERAETYEYDISLFDVVYDPPRAGLHSRSETAVPRR